MPSHYSTIGVILNSPDEIITLANQASAQGEHIAIEKGDYYRWDMGDGAELWLGVINGSELDFLSPHFSGSAKMRVGLTERILREDMPELEGTYHAWADPEDDDPESGAFPLVFDVPNMQEYPVVEFPQIVTVQLAGFSYELSAFRDLEAFDDYQADKELKFSPESFIPAGTFLFNEDDDTPYARAVFTGKVLKTAKLTNGHTGRPFYWAHVRTLGGEVDVVADPDVLEGELVEGGIVYGDFWLSGKIVASEQ